MQRRRGHRTCLWEEINDVTLYVVEIGEVFDLGAEICLGAGELLGTERTESLECRALVKGGRSGDQRDDRTAGEIL